MKTRWKILAALAVVVFCAMRMLRPDHRERDALEQTRRDLRQQGFKTDLSDFNFTTSPELRARAAALTNTELQAAWLQNPVQTLNASLLQTAPELLAPLGSNSAIVLWREAVFPSALPAVWLRSQNDDSPGDDLWPALRDAFEERNAALDAACQAALSGPIRFELEATNGRAMTLRHLSVIKNLSQILGTRAVLALHDNKPDTAWTNLLAATRLVTAWELEPSQVSHLLRGSLAAIVYKAIWQSLQFGGWSDAQLAALQHEWESADFFRGAPETQAFARASEADVYERDRRQPLDSEVPLAYVIRHPRFAWDALSTFYQRVQYRQYGSYLDEQALLLFHRDREVELRSAVLASNWAEMRVMPGVTNSLNFRARRGPGARSVVIAGPFSGRPVDTGQTFLGRTAEAEARRRLIVAAIALERYRVRHGSYPASLSALAPDFLTAPPTDFMDGQPLRYHLTDDGHFVLYAVGLDSVDHNGTMAPRRASRNFAQAPARFTPQPEGDLVWPRPASAADARAQLESEKKAREAQRKEFERTQLAEEQQEEQYRRATVQELLSLGSPARGSEPVYQDRPLSAWLRNPNTGAQTNAAIDELLTVRQVITGQEPDIATFEVPVSYTAVTNLGTLELLVDGDPADLSKSDGTEMPPCTAATNGNCLLVWNTGGDAPGAHALQAKFSYGNGKKRDRRLSEITGPAVPYFSSNLCQFVTERCGISRRSAVLYAKLPESAGVYDVELKSPDGRHLKTVSGTTSNGVIEVRWDLVDDRGQTYTNNSLDSVFHVTLPASGRSMTQRGP